MADPLPNIIVRPVQLQDAANLAALRIEAVRDYPLSFTADLAEIESRPPEWWQDMAGRANGDAMELVLVAEADGNLAGMLGVFTPKQPKLAHVGNVWGVYVRQPFRGRGLGRQMLRTAINWARAKSLVLLKLSVVDGNDTALRCYESCGFTRYGTEPLAVRWEGQLYDEHLLAIRL